MVDEAEVERGGVFEKLFNDHSHFGVGDLEHHPVVEGIPVEQHRHVERPLRPVHADARYVLENLAGLVGPSFELLGPLREVTRIARVAQDARNGALR